jgi:hypothetical protein
MDKENDIDQGIKSELYQCSVNGGVYYGLFFINVLLNTAAMFQNIP